MLDASPPFSALPADARQALVERSSRRAFRTGARLLKQGDRCDHLLVLLDGRARVVLQLEDESVATVAELPSGSVVGDTDLLTGDRCSATVIAMENVEALRVEGPMLCALAAAHPAFAGALLSLAPGRWESVDDLLAHLAHPTRQPQRRAA